MQSFIWGNLDIPISQNYGPTDFDWEVPWNGRYFHCGIDVATPSGTRLFAPRSGHVGQIVSGILSLVLDSGEKVHYVHINQTLIGLGQRFKAGDLIAISGNVAPGGGSTTGPHTHIEVQARGDFLLGTANQSYCVLTSRDPSPYLIPETQEEDLPLTDADFARIDANVSAQTDALAAKLRADVIALDNKIESIYEMLRVGYIGTDPNAAPSILRKIDQQTSKGVI